jgi:hypothetical protein
VRRRTCGTGWEAGRSSPQSQRILVQGQDFIATIDQESVAGEPRLLRKMNVLVLDHFRRVHAEVDGLEYFEVVTLCVDDHQVDRLDPVFLHQITERQCRDVVLSDRAPDLKAFLHSLDRGPVETCEDVELDVPFGPLDSIEGHRPALLRDRAVLKLQALGRSIVLDQFLVTVDLGFHQDTFQLKVEDTMSESIIADPVIGADLDEERPLATMAQVLEDQVEYVDVMHVRELLDLRLGLLSAACALLDQPIAKLLQEALYQFLRDIADRGRVSPG